MADHSHTFAKIELNTVELPPSIEIKESSVINGEAGAFSKMLIHKDTRFGPYKGDIINAGQKDYIDYRFAWEVFEKNSNALKYTISAMDSMTSNWMRHVNCARFFEEQNIISIQDGYSIFYVAMKDIKPGEELLTWFDPKLLKRTRRRLSKMERKPVGYTIELVPWSDEKKFVPEIIETKRARKKKVLSDMICLDENPLGITRTLQRLPKLLSTPKKLAHSFSKEISSSEHKNVSWDTSETASFVNPCKFLKAKKGSMNKSSSTAKAPETVKNKVNSHVFEGYNTKKTCLNGHEEKDKLTDKSFCLDHDTLTLVAEKRNSNVLCSEANAYRPLEGRNKKRRKNIAVSKKNPIKLGRVKHNCLSEGEIIHEEMTEVKPVIITQNADGSTTVEDHDETYILSNVELRAECDGKCPCLDSTKFVTPDCSEKETRGIFVIHFNLLPEHKNLSPDNKIIYKCDVCCSAYNHAFSLKRHYLSVHVNHRYLSRDDIVSCQIETFHTGIELENKGSQSDIQTSLKRSKEPSLVGKQLTSSAVNLSSILKTSVSCVDELQEKYVTEDYKYLEHKESKDKETIASSQISVTNRDEKLIAVSSLTKLAQMAIDKARSERVALSRLVSNQCHSSIFGHVISLECDESLGSDLLCPLECDYTTENKYLTEDASFCFLDADNQKERNSISTDLLQDVQKLDLSVAKYNEGLVSLNMPFLLNDIKMSEKDSFSSRVESVRQCANCEVCKITVGSDIPAQTSENTFDTNNLVASENCCISENSSTTENNQAAYHVSAKSNTITSCLLKSQSISSESKLNLCVEKTSAVKEKHIDKVCKAYTHQTVFEKDIVKSAAKDPDIVNCSSTVNINSTCSKIANSAATSETETNNLDILKVSNLLADKDIHVSEIKVKSSTFSNMVNMGKQSTKSPVKDSPTLQEDYRKLQMSSEYAKDNLIEIGTVTHAKLINCEMTNVSNNQYNFSDTVLSTSVALPEKCSQTSNNPLSFVETPASVNLCDPLLTVINQSTSSANAILTEKSTIQNIKPFSVTTPEGSTSQTTTTPSADSHNQPPQQLIFVTNIVFPVVSTSSHKHIENSTSSLSSAVSQVSSPMTNQTAMSGHNSGIPLVVISQVPSHLSVQNAASAFLQSSAALKTIPTIKKSLNIFNLGNPARKQSSSAVISGHKPTAISGKTLLENSHLLSVLPSTTAVTTVTLAPICHFHSKFEKTTAKLLRPSVTLNQSLPLTAIPSFLCGPYLPASNTGPTKDVIVSKTITPSISSFSCPKKNRSGQPDDLYRCHMCVRLFKTMSELKQHIRNDPHRFKGGIKQYACLQCSMRFSNKNSLMRHNLMNHPENENYKFRCFTCGKGFMSETYLKMHARFHSGKNFPCKYGCVDIYFPNAASLVKHLRTHHAGLDLKEYLRNVKAEKSLRKKRNIIFGVTDEQITSLGIEGSTIKASETVVTSSVPYSLDQPGLGFQAKRGRPKGSKNTSKYIKQALPKLEDKTVIAQEFIPDIKESYTDCETKSKLSFVCNICHKGFRFHLKLLQHRTEKHGANESVQEYLYQMSKEKVDEEISEPDCVKYEFSPPPSPKTFFENVNKRSFENMKHYIDGSSKSIKCLQENQILKGTIAKCEPVSEFRKRLQWTMFNFPPCFEYKEDCTIFYDSIIQSEPTQKLSSDLTEDRKKQDTWNVAGCSQIKSDTESTFLNTLKHIKSANEKFVLHFGNGIAISNEKISCIDDHEKILCVDRKLQNNLVHQDEHKNKSEQRSLDDVSKIDNSEVMNNRGNLTGGKKTKHIHNDHVNKVRESNSLSAYSRKNYDILKEQLTSFTEPVQTNNTIERENQAMCSCIVNEIVNSAVMIGKNTNKVNCNHHRLQSLMSENGDLKTCHSGDKEGAQNMSRCLLDLDVVTHIHGTKAECCNSGAQQEANTVMIPKVATDSCGTVAKTKLNQHSFADLSVKEKLQALKRQHIQGINLEILGLSQHDCSGSFSNILFIQGEKIFSSMSQSCVSLIDALDLHIMGKQYSSKMVQQTCTSLKNASSLLSSGDENLSLESLIKMPHNKQCCIHFDHTTDTSFNNFETSRHDHRRYSIWAGQVHHNYDDSSKEESFCQPVTDAMRKQDAIHQQAKYQSEKYVRDIELNDKHNSTLKICFAEKLGLMTRNEFELSYHAKKQQEFVIKTPDVWENYENIWFGKKGNITVVCSICHRHFSCWDLCLRHQLKKHPHIEPASLEMEKDNYVEDMYYYYPMPYGILAKTHLIPDNLPAPEVYVCTRCGFPFKNLNRLHAHIITCDPAQEESTSSQLDYLKKQPLTKKKLLPMMNRQLYQNIEQNKTKVGQPFTSFYYANNTPFKVKCSKSSISHGKRNMLSLATLDEKPSTSSFKNRSSYFSPFSFYSGRRRKNYEPLYNPQNHTRRRETYKVLDQHQCHGCNLKFKSLSMLERHVKKCIGKDKLQSQKPLLSGIVSDDAALRKQHTCRYCSKRFTYIKGVDLHYKRICAVRKVKEEGNQLSEEDLVHETELKKVIEHIKWSKSLNKDSSDIIQGHVRVEEDGTLTRVVKKRGWPQGFKKKMKKKGFKWTALKRHRPDDDMAYASSTSSSSQNSSAIPAEHIETLDGMKVYQKFDEVVYSGVHKRLTRSTSLEFVNQNCDRTIKRQISTDKDSLGERGRTSQSSVIVICSKSSVPSQNSKDDNRGKIKKHTLDGVDTESKQNRTYVDTDKNRSTKTNESGRHSVSSAKISSNTMTKAFPSCMDTGIKPPPRKRGVPKRFDPSDMESSYKKKKKCDHGYIFLQSRAGSAKIDLNIKKGNRSLASTSKKRQKVELAFNDTSYECESYMLRKKKSRNLQSSLASLHAEASECSLSYKEEKAQNKEAHYAESGKLYAKMKLLKEAAESKRSKSSQRSKSSSPFAIGNMVNTEETHFNDCEKKGNGKACYRPFIKATSSSELLKHLTKDELLIRKHSSQKSVSKGKRTNSYSNNPVNYIAALEDKQPPVKRIKITTLNTSCKTADSKLVITKAVASNALAMLGSKTLTKTTPATSCAVKTSTSAKLPINVTTSNSSGSNRILSDQTSPISKQPVSSVRVVTLSPNGTNLLTYDSSLDVPQSSMLTKATDFTHASLPTNKIGNLPQGSVQLLTETGVHLQATKLRKTIHKQGIKIRSTEQHTSSNSESFSKINSVNTQDVHISTMIKGKITMKKCIVQSHDSQNSISYQTPLNDLSRKHVLTSHVSEFEDKEIHYTLRNTEKQASDSQILNKCEDELAFQNAMVKDTKELCSINIHNSSSSLVLSSKKSSHMSCVNQRKNSLESDKIFNKEIGKTAKVDNTISVRENHSAASSIPQTFTTAEDYSHCQMRDAIMCKCEQSNPQQVSKLVPSVGLSKLKTYLNIKPVQSTWCSTPLVANSVSVNSQESVSVTIVPSTLVEAQVTTPQNISTSVVARLPLPRFGSPSKRVTMTGIVIPSLVQGKVLQSDNCMLKLGSVNCTSTTSMQPQMSITGQCKWRPTALPLLPAITQRALPISADQFPRHVTTGTRYGHTSAQQTVTQGAVTHSLLNIATNQTNFATLPLTRKPAKTFSQPSCMLKSNIVNNTISESSNFTSTAASGSVSNVKLNKTYNSSSLTVSSDTKDTNQIMFCLEDGTTAMLDPDSLAQLLSLSPSLNNSELGSVASLSSDISDHKNKVVLNVTESQQSHSSGDK